MNVNGKNILGEIIVECMSTRDIVKRIKLIDKLNNMLTFELKIKLPAFVTNSYLDKKLHMLDEQLQKLSHSG